MEPPFQIQVTNPGGLRISRVENQVPGAFLAQTDFSLFDAPLEFVIIREPTAGDYLVEIQRPPGVSATESFFVVATEKSGDLAVSTTLAVGEPLGPGETWSALDVPSLVIFADRFEAGDADRWTGVEPPILSVEESCLASGGSVQQLECCGNEFANTCNIGACSCPPGTTPVVWGCDCPPGFCFDGVSCIEY
jgi:hypothetical protein